MRSYVRRDLVRNPRRTLASLVGVALGVGLFSALLFFIDASAATLTKRAIAPVSIDMQRVLSTPLGRQLSLMESASPVGAPAAGQDVHITLTVVNDGTDPANDVVVNDEPAPPLAYVGGTTTLDGSALADVDGRSPLAQGLGRTGLDIGAVPAHAMVTLTYIARAPAGGRAPTDIAFRGTVSSREELVPIAANAAPATTLDQLARAIGAIAGVEGADTLSFVDLPAGSLRAGGERVQAPVRVFAFDRTYVEHYPSIRLVAGGFAPGAVLLSAEADRAVGVAADGAIELQLPGATAPLSLPVSGVADLGQAKPLFSSRKATRFEDFLYVPNVVVVTPAMFEAVVVPAFQSAHAKRGDIIRSEPVREVDVRVNRSLLHRNPSRALAQTTAIAASVQAVASDQDHLIDNISNTLQVAQDDAAVGRRMFLFLGLPAVLLASVLATYASSVHAGAQRREHATLRLHGADAKVLLRVVALQSLALAIVGAAIGAGFGYLSVAVTLGSDEVRAAGARDLVTSGLAALGLGVLTTGLALYVPTRRSLTREVAIERRELVVERDSRWRRWRVDVVVLVAAAVAEIVAFRAGAFDAPSGSVLAGKGVSLPSHLLLAPMLIWLGGTLLVARAVTSLIARLRTPAPPQFGPSVPGILVRSVTRRRRELTTGIVGAALVVGFGVSLALFAASYDAAKINDARFAIGSDLRITPSSASPDRHPVAFGAELRVAGVVAVTPVVSELDNSVLVGPFDQDRRDLAAVDPESFAAMATVSDSFFSGQTAASALSRLRTNPAGLLVDSTTVEQLAVATGDDVEVVLARGTEHQARVTMHVEGIFDRFPGFPQGVHLVMNLARYQEATGLTDVDSFLLRTKGHGHGALSEVSAALRNGPGAKDPINIESTETALDKDQSSLTALDVNGLVDLDSLYTLLMGVAVVAIFVVGLMLQRRREYVVLRALGMSAGQIRAVVLAEAAAVAVGGLVVGLLVGTVMAFSLVHVLRPLFILDPALTVTITGVAPLVLVTTVAAVVAALGATASIGRLRPTELLRDP